MHWNWSKTTRRYRRSRTGRTGSNTPYIVERTVEIVEWFVFVEFRLQSAQTLTGLDTLWV